VLIAHFIYHGLTLVTPDPDIHRYAARIFWIAWRAAGLERAAAFSWERTARATHAVYEEAVRRG
jgi:glycosyltransferase involved in cell wall biosynthesis